MPSVSRAMSTESEPRPISGFGIGEFSPRLHLPKFFLGVSSKPSSIRLDLNVGLHAPAQGPPLPLSAQVRSRTALEWKTNGVWLGASLPLSLTDRFGIALDGWTFWPGSKTVDLGLNGVLEVGIPPTIPILAGTADIQFDVRRVNWYELDLRAEYQCLRNFWLLGGVRYDFLDAVVLGPVYGSATGYTLPPLPPFQALISGASPFSTEIDFDLSSLFPYVGVKTMVWTANTRLALVAKGSPVPLRLGRDAPIKAYFGELCLDYSVVPFHDVTLGFFAKYDTQRAVLKGLRNVLEVYTSGLEKLSAVPAPGVGFDQDATVQWNQLTFGGSFTLDFSLGIP